MKVVIHSVNPVFEDYVLKFAEETEIPHYTFLGTEGPRNNQYVFECDNDNPWTAVAGLKRAISQPPIGNFIFCQVTPYGMLTWPPLVDKDKYPKPEE